MTKLEKGVIYYEGTSKILQDLTGWKGHQILYFGDHLYSDLADVTLEHGWRTGAIIHELSVTHFLPLFTYRYIFHIFNIFLITNYIKHEIETLNNDEFKKAANWLQMLTTLMEDVQDHETSESEAALKEWSKERDEIRFEHLNFFHLIKFA